MKPLVLCILDGVGVREDIANNAVKMAKMPTYNKLLSDYPNTTLWASGVSVGLPSDTMGNSEVGHITIGAGRVVNQYLRRFQLEAESGRLSKNPRLTRFISDVKSGGGIVHLLGLTSDGRVHSDISESIALAEIILASGLNIKWHFISDGRDTPPKSAQVYASKIKEYFSDALQDGRMSFGTLVGRYYAMDRNQNLDRTRAAFDAIANGAAEFFESNIENAINAAYMRGESDEFIKPTIIDTPARIAANDGLLFTNYRADRARQILTLFLENNPPHILAMSQYGAGLDGRIPALLDDIQIKNTLGEVLAKSKKTQLRIAETEKYNHITYFFDAEKIIDYPGEEKILIKSPDVATFDMKPEMSAPEITDALLPRLADFDVVILNYANGDMVGHTGNESAVIRAMDALDACLARLVPTVLKMNGTILITADHGNAEQIWDADGDQPLTSHTQNKVPFIVVSNEKIELVARDDAGLADIAPTMLKILDITQPADMTGKSLI